MVPFRCQLETHPEDSPCQQDRQVYIFFLVKWCQVSCYFGSVQYSSVPFFATSMADLLPSGKKNIAIENGHRNRWFTLIYPLKMVFTQLQNGDISHRFLYVYQRIPKRWFKTTLRRLWIHWSHLDLLWLHGGRGPSQGRFFFFFFFGGCLDCDVTWKWTIIPAKKLRHFKDVLGVLVRYFMSNCRYVLINYHRCLVLLDILMIFDQI